MKKKLVFVFFTFILLLQSTIQVYANSQEITFDVGYYNYEETVDGDYFMSDESSPAFISLGIRKWDTENIENKNLKWLYTFEGTFGNVNYESPGSGTMNTNYYKARLENYLSYKFEKYEKATPFIGLAYRWLYDDSGGKTSSKGHLGYDRQSEYYYVPLGIFYDYSSKLNLKAQYNLFLKGTQNSYLSTASTAYTDLVNDQNSGFGIDLTLNFKPNEKNNVFFYYRYWDINKSETTTGTYADILVFEAYEPKNTTIEYGIGYSWIF